MPPPKIAVSMNLVRIPSNVTDAPGELIPGLKVDEFRVPEDVRAQALMVFETGDAPLTVGLVVDHMRSMGSKLPKVVAAVNSISALLKTGAK